MLFGIDVYEDAEVVEDIVEDTESTFIGLTRYIVCCPQGHNTLCIIFRVCQCEIRSN